MKWREVEEGWQSRNGNRRNFIEEELKTVKKSTSVSSWKVLALIIQNFRPIGGLESRVTHPYNPTEVQFSPRHWVLRWLSRCWYEWSKIVHKLVTCSQVSTGLPCRIPNRSQQHPWFLKDTMHLSRLFWGSCRNQCQSLNMRMFGRLWNTLWTPRYSIHISFHLWLVDSNLMFFGGPNRRRTRLATLKMMNRSMNFTQLTTLIKSCFLKGSVYVWREYEDIFLQFSQNSKSVVRYGFLYKDKRCP